MTEWWKRQRARMTFRNEWGFWMHGEQMAAGYCIIAPFFHHELPWWMVLIGLFLCIRHPSWTYIIMGKNDD